MRTQVSGAFLFALFLTLSFPSFAQLGSFIPSTSIPVEAYGKQLRNAWAGGLNAPQFSSGDFNNDGIEDLLVFDRSGNKTLIFLNGGSPGQVDYEYHPNWEKMFPRMFHWALIRDMNCDGIPDIVTSRPGFIEYFEGSYINDTIRFQYVDYLRYNSFTGLINIFVSAIDIVAFDDLNGDGDMDILTYDFATQNIIQLYENLSMELTGNCGDSLVFEISDYCWGDIYEPGLARTVNILDSCIFPKPHGPSDGDGIHIGSRHAGSTLVTFDEDGDGDKELILGSILFESLNRLLNGGTADSSKIIHQDTLFPSYNVSVDMPMFPAGFFVDVNNNGKKEFIVAPNMQNISRNKKNVLLYENISTNDTAKLNYVMDSFIVGTMIDMGEGAHPAFIDINKDGLLDIVAGNYGYYKAIGKYESRLHYFENIGTPTAPAFRLADDNFMDLASLDINAIHPTFGDLDGDGDLDMIIGEATGVLHYFQNVSPPGTKDSFVLAAPNYFGIDIGNFSTPFLYDLNGDGLLDLIVGERSGNVNYFENKGTANSPLFDPIPTNEFLGMIDVRKQNVIGYSAPVVTSLDTTGKKYILSGSMTGWLMIYEFDPAKLYSGNFTLVADSFGYINAGERTIPAIADLNGDGRPEMVLGNYRGGFHLFSYDETVSFIRNPGGSSNTSIDFLLFPNPPNEVFHIEMTVQNPNQDFTVQVLDLYGRVIREKIIPAPQTTAQFKTEGLSQGVYFVRVQNRSGSKTKKLMITGR